jgi:ribonuclease P protein component
LLPRRNRIKKTDFKRIFRESKAIRTATFTLLYTKNADTKNSQFAVVISNKVEPKAAKRNRVKRQIKAILQDLESKIKEPLKIVVICKPDITKLKFKEIQGLIIDAAKRFT